MGTPAVVVAETTTGRGPADSKTNQVLARLRVMDVGERLARRAGALRHTAQRRDVADALVVALAEQTRGVVVTGDVGDLRALAAHADGVTVEAI